MLDIKFIRENAALVKDAVKKKYLNVDIDQLLAADEKRRGLIQKSEALRAEQKKTQDYEKAKVIKEEFKELEKQLVKVEIEFQELMVRVPMVPSDDTPIGKDEKDNVEVFRSGEIPEFDFQPRDHIALGVSLNIIDFEKGVKVGGFRSYYLKNEGATRVMAGML